MFKSFENRTKYKTVFRINYKNIVYNIVKKYIVYYVSNSYMSIENAYNIYTTLESDKNCIQVCWPRFLLPNKTSEIIAALYVLKLIKTSNHKKSEIDASLIITETRYKNLNTINATITKNWQKVLY